MLFHSHTFFSRPDGCPSHGHLKYGHMFLQVLLKKGVSKVRHLDTKLLWLQRSHSQGQLELSAVGTHLNTSDIGTKQLTSERYRFLLDRMGYATDLMPGFHNVTQIRKVEAKVVKYLMVLEALRSLPPASAQSASHDEPNVEMTNFEVVFQSSNALSIKGADLIGIFISVVIIVGLTLRLLCSCSRWWSGVRRRREEHHQSGDSHRGHHRPGDEHQRGHHRHAEDLHQGHRHAEDLHQRHRRAEDLHQRHRHAEDLHQGHRHAEDLHQGHPMLKIYIFVLMRRKMYAKRVKVNLITNLAVRRATCSLTGVSQDTAPESNNQQFQMHITHQDYMKL